MRPLSLLAVLPCLVLLCLGSGGSSASAVELQWTTVAGPGNADSPWHHGEVAYAFRISRYEVTNAQYAEFLSEVAVADPNGLYDTRMGDPDPPNLGGIVRTGSPGAFAYAPIAGREGKPVNWVSFPDALRFANWLHNGRPAGPQSDATTEDGAYTITAQGLAANSIQRNAGARVFLPTHDEWYKAAYYDVGAASYFLYPAGSDTPTGCTDPTDAPNAANCSNPFGDLEDVGSYPGSPSPSGTFDQGGNVWEWNESIWVDGTARGIGGGAYDSLQGTLEADGFAATSPSNARSHTGMRVAASAPGVPALGTTGFGILAGLMAVSARRRLRPSR